MKILLLLSLLIASSMTFADEHGDRDHRDHDRDHRGHDRDHRDHDRDHRDHDRDHRDRDHRGDRDHRHGLFPFFPF